MASMAALFTILAVICYLLGRASDRSGRRWLYFVLAGLSWALGLMSKETAAIAPLLVLLAEYGVVRHGQPIMRYRWDRALLLLPVVLGVLIIIDIASGAGPLANRFLSEFGGRDFTAAERLLTQPRVILFHVSQILWPMPGRFALEHQFVYSTGLLSPASTLAAMLAIVAWCSVGVWALFQPRWRIAGFFLLWVPATLVIESSFVALEMVFEHRMYLPSVALAGLAAMGLAGLLTRGSQPRVAVLGVAAVIVVLLMVSTSIRVPDWRSSVSLAQATVRTSPESARAWATLANAYKESGAGWDKIKPPMMKALLLDPQQSLALQLQVFRLIETGMFSQAEDVLNRIRPGERGDHRFLNTLGMLRLEQRDFAAAVESFERALRIDVSIPEVRYNLALSYELWGRCAVAHEKWLEYLQYDSDQHRRAAVQSRLMSNFQTEGGRCYGWERS
jgi:Flp pilus assembly protein TadD